MRLCPAGCQTNILLIQRCPDNVAKYCATFQRCRKERFDHDWRVHSKCEEFHAHSSYFFWSLLLLWFFHGCLSQNTEPLLFWLWQEDLLLGRCVRKPRVIFWKLRAHRSAVFANVSEIWGAVTGCGRNSNVDIWLQKIYCNYVLSGPHKKCNIFCLASVRQKRPPIFGMQVWLFALGEGWKKYICSSLHHAWFDSAGASLLYQSWIVQY